MVTIACVLKTGGYYDDRWVERLKKNVAAFAPAAHRFVCLTDLQTPIVDNDGQAIPGLEVARLEHGWREWWSKIELFRPGLFKGRVLYIDLDDLVVGDITPLLESGPFTIARDPYRRGAGRFSSAVMSWDADDPLALGLYSAFVPASEVLMRDLHGDQDWVMRWLPEARTWPFEFVPSFKGDCRPAGRIPEKAIVVTCHGRPKPDEISEPWFRERWLANGGW